MTKILFVCHGNICRSPTAEFVMKDLVRRAGIEGEFEIASAAAHTDEIGNPVYPPSRKMLAQHGIDCSEKRARLMHREDYAHYDLLIGMDEENLRDMRRLFGVDESGKLHNMMEYAGRPHDAVADPWYTRNFERTWLDVTAACQGLLESLTGIVTLDFSRCADIPALYALMREKMAWQDWYGQNLDALYDILTGLPHHGERFVLLPPESPSAELAAYMDKLRSVFADAGALLG